MVANVKAINMVVIGRSEDYSAISQLLRNSPSLEYPPGPTKLRRMEDATFFVAKKHREPVGVVCVQKLIFFMTVLKYLFVREEHRREGIGHELVQEAVNYTRNSIGTPTMIATVVTTNRIGIWLMLRHGFRPIARTESPVSENMLLVMFNNLHTVPFKTEGIEETVLEVGR